MNLIEKLDGLEQHSIDGVSYIKTDDLINTLQIIEDEIKKYNASKQMDAVITAGIDKYKEAIDTQLDKKNPKTNPLVKISKQTIERWKKFNFTAIK